MNTGIDSCTRQHGLAVDFAVDPARLNVIEGDARAGRLDATALADLCAGIVPVAAWPCLLAADYETSPGFRLEPSFSARALGIQGVRIPPVPVALDWLAERSLAVSAPGAPQTHTPVTSGVRTHLAAARDLLGIDPDLASSLGDDGRLGIADSGLDEDHPDFRRCPPVDRVNFTSERDTDDTCGHGTHCAGIARGDGSASGGLLAGVSPLSQLIVSKVFDAHGICTTGQVIQAMQYLATEGGCDIASFSLGAAVPPDGKSLLSVGAERMAKLGVIVVGSAGNSGPGESSITAPGDAPLVITVGAVDKQLGLAQFSSRGGTSDASFVRAKPDVVAPGVDISAPRARNQRYARGGDRYYMALSGTSMACPAVAGLLALLLSYARKNGLSTRPDVLREALADSCLPITGPSGAPLSRHEVGSGMPRLGPAIAALRTLGSRAA